MIDANLERLQAMVQRVLEEQHRAEIKLDRIGDDLGDLRLRTINTEEALAGVNRRLDRLDARVERIERRLDLSPVGSLRPLSIHGASASVQVSRKQPFTTHSASNVVLKP